MSNGWKWFQWLHLDYDAVVWRRAIDEALAYLKRHLAYEFAVILAAGIVTWLLTDGELLTSRVIAAVVAPVGTLVLVIIFVLIYFAGRSPSLIHEEQVHELEARRGLLDVGFHPHGFPEVYLTNRTQKDSGTIPVLDVIVLPNLTILVREENKVALSFHLEIRTGPEEYLVINDPDRPEYAGWKQERLRRTNNEATFLAQPTVIDGPNVLRGDLAFTAGMNFRYSLSQKPYWKEGRFDLFLYAWDEFSDRKIRVSMGWLLTSCFYDAKP